MSIDVSADPRLSRRVAAEVRAEMARKRITGRALARMLGRSPNWVSLKTSGAQGIDLDDLESFAAALGVTIVDLLPRRDRGVTEPYPPEGQETIDGVDFCHLPDFRSAPSRPRDNRPNGHASPGRTSRTRAA
jgi:transcriptional regulator with XRE-family HTH domain